MEPGSAPPQAGPAGVSERIPTHEHIVAFYERDDELATPVAVHLAEALAVGGSGLVIATPGHRAAIDAALVAGGLDPEELRRTGRYRTLDAAETIAAITNAGEVDRAAFTRVIGTALDELGATGPLHVFGEIVALLWDAGAVDAAIALESGWNDLADLRAFSLYCAYPMASLRTGSLGAAKRVCDRHSRVRSLSVPRREDERARTVRAEALDRLFVPVAEVVRDVRDFVRSAFLDWGEESRVAEAEIIAGELASNAVVHARSPFRVSVARSASVIRIEVRDGSQLPPELYDAGVVRRSGRQGGRGVAIVASLSSAWATRTEVDGKTIWATVARSA